MLHVLLLLVLWGKDGQTAEVLGLSCFFTGQCSQLGVGVCRVKGAVVFCCRGRTPAMMASAGCMAEAEAQEREGLCAGVCPCGGVVLRLGTGRSQALGLLAEGFS